MSDSSDSSPGSGVPHSLKWSGMTHPGRVRTHNEDAFLALTFDGRELRFLGKEGEAPLDAFDFVFAVSDGMGGANAGEFASRIAVDRLTRLFPKAFRAAVAGFSTGFKDVLEQLFSEIHEEMRQMGRSYEECAGMGATLSLCWITPEWLYFAHLGDSRIYYLPATGGIRQLSHDHTLPGRLLRSGEITEREARQHPRRHELEQVLGAQRRPLDVQVGAVGIEPGDRFLICSDGITDGILERNLDALLRRPVAHRAEQTPARRLVDEGIMRSGRDNLTAVVVEVRAAEP